MNKLDTGTDFYKWMHDDITWCMDDKCENTECERNQANRMMKTGIFSAALFRGTDYCPLYKGGESNEQRIHTLSQGKC